MGNKHLIILILIISLAFVVAFAALSLASNAAEKPVINASSTNDSNM